MVEVCRPVLREQMRLEGSKGAERSRLVEAGLAGRER